MDSEQPDRLSSLTTEILPIILSFLPTTTAISTEILSPSWHGIWTDITALRFTVNYIPTPQFEAFFFGILRRVKWPKIEAIELNIEPPKSKPPYTDPNTRFIDVIHNIVYNGSNVKQLKFNFIKSGNSSYSIKLPIFIFEKKSIEVLEMHGFMLQSGVNYKLSNLRKLGISVRQSNVRDLANLVNSCVLLEVLRVHIDVFEIFEDPIQIIAQKLKWLSIKVVFYKTVLLMNKVLVNAPKLKYLEVDSTIMLKFSFRSTPSGLVKAKVSMGDMPDRKLSDIESTNPKQGLAIINTVFRVRTLDLSSGIVLALSFLDHNIEIFHKLTHLEMTMDRSRGWGGVKRFLQSCPNLQSLVLRREHAKHEYPRWFDIDIVPCLMAKLERIELLNYYGTEHELNLIMEYIVNFAKDLKMLNVTTIVCKDYNKMVRSALFQGKLHKLSIELPTCQINISSV